MGDEHTSKTKNQSGIEGDLRVTREEARAIQSLCEEKMGENAREDKDEHVFPLGGDNWADLDALRLKAKKFQRNNQ